MRRATHDVPHKARQENAGRQIVEKVLRSMKTRLPVSRRSAHASHGGDTGMRRPASN